jgi:hypothetical protein
MSTLNTTKLVIAAVAAALLTACGGGGGGTTAVVGPVASTLTFNASSAIRSLNASGQTATFSVSSSNGCTGSASYTVGAATTSTTFETQTALSSTSMLNINYTNCTPATISSTTTNYMDSNYAPLGVSGEKYIVYTGYTAPTTARVGDVGIIGNFLRYTNISKTTQDGTGQFSYVVEADSENTAFITAATKAYSIPTALESTQLTKYRINSSNVMSLVSITIQYANGLSIVLTRT